MSRIKVSDVSAVFLEVVHPFLSPPLVGIYWVSRAGLEAWLHILQSRLCETYVHIFMITPDGRLDLASNSQGATWV